MNNTSQLCRKTALDILSRKILKKKCPLTSVDFAEILRNANFWPNHNWSPVVKSEVREELAYLPFKLSIQHIL